MRAPGAGRARLASDGASSGSPSLPVATQHDQHWMPRREELDAGVDVPSRKCQQPGRLLGIGSATCTAGQGITSRRRAQRQKQGQGAQPVGLRCKVEIRVEDGIAEIAAAMQLEIHQQEGEIVEDVDTADLVAELDAVEQRRLARVEADIGEPKIAMTAAHSARIATPVEQRGQSIECGPCMAAQRADGGTVQFGSYLCEFAIVVRDHPPDRFGSSMLRRLVGNQMQARHRFAQSMHQFRRQRPHLRHAIEQIGLGKPAHDHHVIECRPLATERENTAWATIDRADTDVKLAARSANSARFPSRTPSGAIHVSCSRARHSGSHA